jgi:hypothetical protein
MDRLRFFLESFKDCDRIESLTTREELTAQSIKYIATKCKNLSRLVAAKCHFPLAAFNWFPTSIDYLHVASIDFGQSDRVMATANCITRLREIEILKLEDSLTNLQIRNLFVQSINGLRQIHISGEMTNTDIERIKRNAPHISGLIVETTYFDLWHLNSWRKLFSVDIRACVKLRFTPISISFKHLGYLVIRNAQDLDQNQFTFLNGFLCLQVLYLQHSRQLTSLHLRNALTVHYRDVFQHLNLSYTAALDDYLLSLLRQKCIRLVTLVANYPSTQTLPNQKSEDVSQGFTDEGLSEFLSWSENTRLRKLGVCGHTGLTKKLYAIPIKSISVLQELDLRDCSNELMTSLVDMIKQRRIGVVNDFLQKNMPFLTLIITPNLQEKIQPDVLPMLQQQHIIIQVLRGELTKKDHENSSRNENENQEDYMREIERIKSTILSTPRRKSM